MDLFINTRLIIPSKELKWSFSRAKGPGGQAVNKVESQVELLLNLEKSYTLSPFQKHRLLEKLKSQVVNGALRVVAKEERSQYQNRKVALARMKELLIEGLKPPQKARKSTKPGLKAKNQRIKIKKIRGDLKRKRQKKVFIEG
ncbi:alternative ribosome rescue aminoacyl-tRNA hydrolase ArfB [Prochlorococcus sp. MIT 1307]|uniref:alternative ribosome rescue aminoacyl-tRNA hydrolase ArfB n=1 Tax=Prochlorococcus sp. MIT 1307 TaxID=3096219 RepID=UPI002A761C26|nr:alternative ribosome rescue aminoacyl-tRNA hydrolase ArfB [Prochlorococcus sp. MIT 1307]